MITIGDILSSIDAFKRRVGTMPGIADAREFGSSDPDVVGAVGSVMPGVNDAAVDELSRTATANAEDSGATLGLLSGAQGAALAAGPIGKIVKGGEKAGQYRGTAGFGGITPQKATALRNQFIADATTGAPYSKYWYDEASQDLLRVAGGDPEKAKQLASVMATLSSGTPVGANTMFGFKGWNQNLIGDTLNTGMYPNAMRPALQDVFDSASGTTGLKRTPFEQGLSVAFSDLSPEEIAKLRPVNDIHQASALTGQLVRRGLSPAEHAFLDSQMDAIVPALNARAQQAIDAARAAGVPEDQIAKMDQPDWNNMRAQAAAWSTQRLKSGAAKSMEEAGQHYGDFLNQYAGNVTREWTPGMNTGHLPEMINNPQLAQEYADTMEPFVRGEGGVDQLAHDMGALTDTVLDNPGVYGAERNPGFATPIMVGKATGSDALDPASKQVMRSVAAAHGLIGTQQQVAGNFLGGPSPAIRLGALLFNRNTPIVGDELRQLQDIAMARGLEAPQADPRGARALVFGDGKEAAKAGKDVAYQFGAKVSPQSADTFIFPADENFNAPAKWSAQPFIDEINAGGPKMAAGFDSFMQRQGPSMLQAVDSMAQRTGMTQAPWYRAMMEGLSQGGLPRLQELVKQGVVPVAALAALGLASQMDRSAGPPSAQ